MKTPTFYEYLTNNLLREDGPVIDHVLRCELVTLHGVKYARFYIHPLGKNGETPTYMVSEDRGIMENSTEENKILPAYFDTEIAARDDGSLKPSIRAEDPFQQARQCQYVKETKAPTSSLDEDEKYLTGLDEYAKKANTVLSKVVSKIP